MKTKFLVAFAMVGLFSCGVFAQTAPDAAELTKLLNDFLAGASRNDAAIHERFWADDLIYTRSAGRRVNKAEVMHDVRNTPAPKPADPKTVYTAEDIQIQQYGDTAVVAFRLVATTENSGAKHLANLLNSGTFVKRDGKWQVVNWQSTRMPRTEAESKNEVTSADAAFHQAILSGNLDQITALTDPNFVWTNGSIQTTRQQLLDDLRARKVKYGKTDPAKVSISVYGDTAIVRGEALPPNSTHYTLTFINQLGVWRAVSLHTST
ncbi:MAG TPA: nuclear transport factor 2 family protein [Pyrinomonadaceae bacterium]|jgi:ketosteroid isomerase-like protein|nr:nuclear transport factor 2 family protein [Pyrinomonadaceae bacterium]